MSEGHRARDNPKELEKRPATAGRSASVSGYCAEAQRLLREASTLSRIANLKIGPTCS
jgi:hypothetical protein